MINGNLGSFKNIKELVNDHEERISKLEKILLKESVALSGSKNARQTIEEFLLKKSPKYNRDTLAVLGYFIEFIEGKNDFTIADLRDAWKRARMPNIADRKFQKLVNNTLSYSKYFISLTKKGSYKMSRKGKCLVDNLPKVEN